MAEYITKQMRAKRLENKTKQEFIDNNDYLQLLPICLNCYFADRNNSLVGGYCKFGEFYFIKKYARCKEFKKK